MKNYITIILAAMLLSSCSNTQTTNTTTVKDSTTTATVATKGSDTSISRIKEYLLASFATDFDKGAQHPAQFREVKMGHRKNDDGSNIYFICGQFRTAQDKSKWIPFATVKTSGYEQYLGTQATNFCSDTSVVWEQGGDLSADLIEHVTASKK